MSSPRLNMPMTFVRVVPVLRERGVMTVSLDPYFVFLSKYTSISADALHVVAGEDLGS